MGVQQAEEVSEDAVLRPISINKSNRLTKELEVIIFQLYTRVICLNEH